MNCLLCTEEAWHSAFCPNHVKGWIGSEERAAIDFSSEESYNAGSQAYANRIQISSGADDTLRVEADPTEMAESKEG